MELRITVAVATVLRVFLEEVTASRYGYELMRLTGYPSGKLYPILARLEAAGWLEAEFEDAVPAVQGRPVRKLYSLTADGAAVARRELAALHQQLTPASRVFTRLRPAGGHP